MLARAGKRKMENQGQLPNFLQCSSSGVTTSNVGIPQPLGVQAGVGRGDGGRHRENGEMVKISIYNCQYVFDDGPLACPRDHPGKNEG